MTAAFRRPLLGLLGLVCLGATVQAQTGEALPPAIVSVLEDYRTTVAGEPADSLLAQTGRVAGAILEGHRVFFLDQTLKGIYGGMAFTRQKDTGVFGLAFGPDFLKTYRPGSAPHLTVLAHELWHYRDFTADAEAYAAQDDDPTEKLLYEMDAIHVEGDFVRLARKQGLELTSFEQFVLASYEGDYLASVVLYLKSESQAVVFDFRRRLKNLGGRTPDPRVEFAQVAALGNQLLEAYAPFREGGDYRGFARFIDLTTFRKQLQQFVPAVLRSPETTWDEVFRDYPDLARFYWDEVAVEKADLDRWSGFRRQVVGAWEQEAAAAGENR